MFQHAFKYIWAALNVPGPQMAKNIPICMKYNVTDVYNYLKLQLRMFKIGTF